MSLVGADSGTYVSGLQVRTKYNADLLSIVQKFKQATAPTETEPLMWWFDTASSILKLRNEADDVWISLFYIDGSNDLYLVGPTRIVENSDTIILTHDGTDARITMSDGRLVVQTAEGTNTVTTLAVMGKGTEKGGIEIHDQSAANKVTVTVDDAIGADREFRYPSNAPAAGKFLKSVADTGRTEWDDPPSGNGGRSEFPGTLMNFVRSGTSLPPMYMHLDGSGATITMADSAAKTDRGWQAQITNGAANAARFGWNTGQNACGNLVDVYRLRGEYLTMGAWVHATTASRVKLELSDGTTTTTSTAYHAGGGWEWMEVTLAATVDAAATVLTAYVLIEAGDAITIHAELPCVVRGTACPAHVGYVSRNRFYVEGCQINASGDRSITGCGFSPVAYTINQVNNKTPGYFSNGGAYLIGATTTSIAANSGTASTGYVWLFNGGNYGVPKTFDSDGVTFTNTFGGNLYALFITLYEGNPE